MNNKYLGAFALTGLVLLGCSGTAERPALTAGAGCDQLGDPTRAAAPFYEPGNVFSAQKVEKTDFQARAIQPRRTVGAEMYMHAQPGLTGEYLQRALSCHASRGAVAHVNDPLHPTSGKVKAIEVRSVQSGFAVKVIGDKRAGQEIWARARAFATPGSSVNVEQLAATGGTSKL